MFAFSLIAVFVTSLWNKGFVIKPEPVIFLQASAVVAVLYYIIQPITKIVLFPLNLLTFGLISLLAYSFLFYIATTSLTGITVTGWTFSGLTSPIVIPKLEISQLQNIVLSSFSVSVIITALEKAV